jgi:predicted LPLAT superfamily acyltransferase
MDFDIEIMVRLIWEGVPVVKHYTKVIYPEGGHSNFDYLHDNVLITKMHTKLVLGMLARLPSRLFRGADRRDDEAHWSEIQEVGAVWPMRLLVWSYRVFGSGFFRAVMWPVAGYYYVTHKKARQASRDYLEKVYRSGSRHPALKSEPNWRTSFRHILTFAHSNVDRVASWMGQMKLTDLHFEQKDEFLELHNRRQGAVLVSSHLGNIEMCRALITQFPGVKMHILMHTQHAGMFNKVLREINEKADLGIIQVNRIGPETALFLKERVEQGEYVVILGDRTPVRARERVSKVEFLGKTTVFPQGPYVMAHLLDCPVYVMFCLAEEGGYRLYMEKFAERIKLARKDRETQLQALAQRYADILEQYCLREPLQWFNFYDFWHLDGSDGSQNERYEDKAS